MNAMRTLILITGLVFAGAFPALAQEEEVGAVPVEGSGAGMHQSFLDSADTYKKVDIGRSIEYITRSIGSLGASGNQSELAESLSMLGEVYEYHGQFDLAIGSFKDALEAEENLRTRRLLGVTYILDGQYGLAEQTLLPLLGEREAGPFETVTIYEALGDVYKGQKRYNQAIDYYGKSLELAKANLISPKVTDLNSKIAETYALSDSSEKAEEYFGNSLQMAEVETPSRAIREKERVADFYSKRNRYEEEIAMRKKSLRDLDQVPQATPARQGFTREPDTLNAQRINYKIANAYIAQDKFVEAIPYLEESIKAASREDDLAVQKDATRALSEAYRETGDFTRALESYRSYVTVVDSLYRRKELEIERAARFNREIASKQSRITGLEQERQLSQSKYELALTEQELVGETNKRQKWIIYSLIFGLFLMALAAFFFYRSHRQQQLANKLLALKSLRTQMNPHFIFNALNSVNTYIAKNDERSANRYLSDFSILMRAVLENSEEDFISLSRELDLIELYVKLEHSRFPDKFRYTIRCDEQLDTEAFKIPPMLLQPYIENAIWHGLRYRETQGVLNISLNQPGQDTVVIVISDNGIGRKRSAEIKTENQKRQQSKGMGNIEKRIAILNAMDQGKVAVKVTDLDAESPGTRVTLTLKK